MARDIGKFIGQQARKTANTTSQLGRKGIPFTSLPANQTKNTLEIYDARLKTIYQNIVGDTLIWGGGSPYGLWGQNWGADFERNSLTAYVSNGKVLFI